jgi:hypothetical protein
VVGIKAAIALSMWTFPRRIDASNTDFCKDDGLFEFGIYLFGFGLDSAKNNKK